MSPSDAVFDGVEFAGVAGRPHADPLGQVEDLRHGEEGTFGRCFGVGTAPAAGFRRRILSSSATGMGTVRSSRYAFAVMLAET